MSFPFSTFDASGTRPRTVREGYAIWSGTYDEMLSDDLDGPLLAQFARHLPSESARVIDPGCGTGRTGAWPRREFLPAAIDGLDVSPEMIAELIDHPIGSGFVWRTQS
jgi:trans-aconitate methyltransferase